MKTKRSQEGVVLIDHRNSPGITPEFIRANNLDAPAVGAGVTFESALIVCSHCGDDVILNPNRSKPREWCWTCDKYICDRCATNKKLGMPCVTVRQKMERFFERIVRSA